MLTYSKLVRKPKTFRTFTGLKVEEFDKLCTKIESKYPEYEAKRLHREDRIKAIGQGRVYRNIKYLESLVKACIPLPEKLHKKI